MSDVESVLLNSWAKDARSSCKLVFFVDSFCVSVLAEVYKQSGRFKIGMYPYKNFWQQWKSHVVISLLKFVLVTTPIMEHNTVDLDSIIREEQANKYKCFEYGHTVRFYLHQTSSTSVKYSRANQHYLLKPNVPIFYHDSKRYTKCSNFLPWFQKIQSVPICYHDSKRYKVFRFATTIPKDNAEKGKNLQHQRVHNIHNNRSSFRLCKSFFVPTEVAFSCLYTALWRGDYIPHKR